MSCRNKDVKEKRRVSLKFGYVSANIVLVLFTCNSIWGKRGLNIVAGLIMKDILTAIHRLRG